MKKVRQKQGQALRRRSRMLLKNDRSDTSLSDADGDTRDTTNDIQQSQNPM